jgi:hypothetical protein
VVFVAADAGIGRLVAKLNAPSLEAATDYTLETPPEGPEFTDEHPRLHYGWTTSKEYRRRFGYLDYMRRFGPDMPYARDAGPPVQLPHELEERCSFVLYPYVTRRFAEAVTWSVHSEALEQLRAGAAHPAREQVLELASLAEAKRPVWAALDDAERDRVIAHETDREHPMPGQTSAELQRYLGLDDDVEAIAATLQAQEFEKIHRALAALDDWLLHGK